MRENKFVVLSRDLPSPIRLSWLIPLDVVYTHPKESGCNDSSISCHSSLYLHLTVVEFVGFMSCTFLTKKK